MSVLTPNGVFSCADVAGPPTPAAPGVPATPAMIVTPEAPGACLNTAWMVRSVMRRSPLGATAMPHSRPDVVAIVVAELVSRSTRSTRPLP